MNLYDHLSVGDIRIPVYIYRCFIFDIFSENIWKGKDMIQVPGGQDINVRLESNPIPVSYEKLSYCVVFFIKLPRSAFCIIFFFRQFEKKNTFDLSRRFKLNY